MHTLINVLLIYGLIGAAFTLLGGLAAVMGRLNGDDNEEV